MCIYALEIYLYPCLQITVSNFVYWFIFEVCAPFFNCFKFTDSKFKPDDSSLGKQVLKDLNSKKVSWKRCCEIESTVVVGKETVQQKLHKLFSKGIAAEDICQGNIRLYYICNASCIHNIICVFY